MAIALGMSPITAARYGGHRKLEWGTCRIRQNRRNPALFRHRKFQARLRVMRFRYIFFGVNYLPVAQLDRATAF
jgi:hypothetical protein